MKRRLGPAWLEREDDGELRRRGGRRKPGYLDEQAAVVAKDRLVFETERELRERALAGERAANAPVTFREVAHAYLHWLEHVRDAKPKTLQDTATCWPSPTRRTAVAAGRTAASSCARSATGQRPR